MSDLNKLAKVNKTQINKKKVIGTKGIMTER